MALHDSNVCIGPTYRVNETVTLNLTCTIFLKTDEQGKFEITMRDPQTWTDSPPHWRAYVGNEHAIFPNFITAAAWALQTYEKQQAAKTVLAQALPF